MTTLDDALRAVLATLDREIADLEARLVELRLARAGAPAFRAYAGRLPIEVASIEEDDLPPARSRSPRPTAPPTPGEPSAPPARPPRPVFSDQPRGQPRRPPAGPVPPCARCGHSRQQNASGGRERRYDGRRHGVDGRICQGCWIRLSNPRRGRAATPTSNGRLADADDAEFVGVN